MKNVYGYLARQGTTSSRRFHYRRGNQESGGRESISFNPIHEGDFWSHHSWTMFLCLLLSLFFGLFISLILADPEVLSLDGLMFLLPPTLGFVVAVAYPMNLYRKYKTIKGHGVAVGSGALEVTANILASQRDPVVTLQYRKMGAERFHSVPMSRKRGKLFSAIVPPGAVLEGDDESVMQYEVKVEDGGTAEAVNVVVH